VLLGPIKGKLSEFASLAVMAKFHRPTEGQSDDVITEILKSMTSNRVVLGILSLRENRSVSMSDPAVCWLSLVVPEALKSDRDDQVHPMLEKPFDAFSLLCWGGSLYLPQGTQPFREPITRGSEILES
jgi:hypothetical protein